MVASVTREVQNPRTPQPEEGLPTASGPETPLNEIPRQVTDQTGKIPKFDLLELFAALPRLKTFSTSDGASPRATLASPLSDPMDSPLESVLKSPRETGKSWQGTQADAGIQMGQHSKLVAQLIEGFKTFPQQVQIMAARGDVKSAEAQVEKLERTLRELAQASAAGRGSLKVDLEQNSALQAAARWLAACRERLEHLQS